MKLSDIWFFYVTLPMRNRRENPKRLLRKMAKVAGYKYDDCVFINDNGDKEWDYKKGWTQKQEDEYKRWFMRQIRHLGSPEKEWGMWNLMFGFKIIR